MGKTSITLRFAKNEFDQNQKSTLNAFFLEQQIRVADGRAGGGDPKLYKLAIWDTAGQEEHHSLNTIYYRNSQGALIVYDITDVDSFRKMADWVRELRNQLGNQLPIVVVANKADLESNRQVALSDGENYAKSLGLDHFSASAKTGKNITEVFKRLTERKSAVIVTVEGIVAGRPVKSKKVAKVRGGLGVQGLDLNDDREGSIFDRKSDGI